MKEVTNIRLKIIASIIVVVVLVLGARLYLVQVVHGDIYSRRADQQYVRPEQKIFNRGSIYLSDKPDNERFAAATLKSGYLLAINPQIISDPQAVYQKLSSFVDINKQDFLLRAGKEDDPYEEVAYRLTEQQRDQIKDMNIPGVATYTQRWRYYPGEELAARVIGFVGFEGEGDERVGQYGVEREYEGILDRDDKETYVNFFAQVFSSIKQTVINDTRKRSGDIVLTLNATDQAFLQETLRSVRDRWNTEKSMGVIIDPNTGAIRAMATVPSFDLNNYSSVADQSKYANPLVEDVYEMGSIIKPITMAAGLDTGAVTPETQYVDEGTITVNDSEISNYDGKARGRVSMQAVLNESLNTGAAFVEQEMGNTVFREYLNEFGLDTKTGIDLPNEATPLVENLNSPRNIEHVTASFGQGVAVSPMQTIRALSVLANDGELIVPHIGKRVEYDLGFSRDLHTPEENRPQVIAPNTADTITRMLVRVVDEALQNGEVKLDRYSVAAKTGTAQVAKPNSPGYYEEIFNHSFFGYFPAYDPEYLVFLMNIRPQGAKYASQTLTDPFMDIVRFLINSHEIAPDRKQPTTADPAVEPRLRDQ